MNFLYDPEADASYLTICTCEIAQTVHVGGSVFLDFAEDSHIIGVEVLEKVDANMQTRVEHLLKKHAITSVHH